ncbi:MAG: cytochrome c biogenesis CcdA family protein, partial [Miltoncostaeaceae bacterium]
MLLLVVVAFVAGAVTALSPCFLPALPVVVAGTATGGRRRLLGVAVGFVATFTVFTLSLAAALRAVGLGPTLLRNVAIALVIVFGLALILPRLDARIAGWLAPVAGLGDRWARSIERRDSDSGLGLALGAALGLVWTPCAGPLFAAIAAVAAAGGVGLDAFLVLGAYSIGAIIPLLALGYGGQRLLLRLAPKGAALRPALGALMVVAGVILFLGVDTRLTEVATRDVPG